MSLNLEFAVLIPIFIASAVVVLVLRIFKNKPDHRHYPPTFPSIPIVGSLPFLGDFNELPRKFMQKSEDLGPIFTVKLFNRLTLILNSREAVEDALIKHSCSFSGREGFYTDKNYVNLNRKGIVSKQYDSDFKKYHSLTLNILKEFGFGDKNLMEERIHIEVENMIRYIEKENGKQFDPRELTVLASSNVIKSIVLGKRHQYKDGMDEIGHNVDEWLRNMDTCLEVAPILRFLPHQRKKLEMLSKSHEKLLAALENEIKVILNGGNDDCFVRRFSEQKPKHDSEQLLFMIRDLVGGGTDTTATSVRFLLALMANHPNVQKRLCEEIDSVVPKERLPSLSDKPRLPYVEATIMELWRFKTSVPFAPAHLTLTDTTVHDYFVPAGTVVLANLYAVHMNPKDWGDPDVFRPERFLDKDSNVVGKDKIIPFSVGRRSCIGEALAVAEIFLITSGLLQHFHIKPPEGQQTISFETINSQVTTPTPFNICLIPRDK